MNTEYITKIAEENHITANQVEAVGSLLADGATVPFIARYRKEATGSLDEVVITAIRDRLKQLQELDDRRQTILSSLEKHGHLTDDLKAAVAGAENLSALEDIYLPYKPRRRTKATVAREKGLEPLALALMAQTGADPDRSAQPFVDPEKGVATVAEALEGARHILSEIISEDADARAEMRDLFFQRGIYASSIAGEMTEQGAKFKDYFDWKEKVASAPSHRVLAMRRGEREGVLNLTIAPPEEDALALLRRRFVTGHGPDAMQVDMAAVDAYKRLLSRAMETETRLWSKEQADKAAIDVFARNLKELLLTPPLGSRRVMGVDTGFRTGCKIVCLDAQGALRHHDTLYLHQPERAAETILRLCREYDIQAIAVGNGTAGRESEAFLRGLGLPDAIQIIRVDESGASIYSASEVAREEFPDLDLTVRGGVSIGRRLMDPLSELVKIDPKSIGVGQYQHDVDQTALRQALDDVVIHCVNSVGVDLNHASAQLLTYVSGLGPQLAKNIVAHRNENGPFRSRKDLRTVKRLGPKAFEQCAGFLRIPGADNPLDASAVHPESYPLVERMARDLDCTVADLIRQEDLRRRINIQQYVTDTVGLPTLADILSELARPGRDPRKQFEFFAFSGEVSEITDLKPGMRLPGIVTNVTAFGAFVDVGVHQDGLVHISQLADHFVKDPTQVVKVSQKVSVTVLEVDVNRRRIALSMKTGGSGSDRPAAPGPEGGSRPGRPPKRPTGPKPDGGKARSPKPFNNPFADALGKLSK